MVTKLLPSTNLSSIFYQSYWPHERSKARRGIQIVLLFLVTLQYILSYQLVVHVGENVCVLHHDVTDTAGEALSVVAPRHVLYHVAARDGTENYLILTVQLVVGALDLQTRTD